MSAVLVLLISKVLGRSVEIPWKCGSKYEYRLMKDDRASRTYIIERNLLIWYRSFPYSRQVGV